MIGPGLSVPTPLSGGKSAFKCALSPFPLWSQVGDWTADGQPDENKENNCGPETVASIIKYLTDIELPSDYIHDVITQEGYLGYFQTNWLVSFFRRYCSIRTVEYFPRSMDELTYQIWFYLHQGKPCYWLRSFSSPDAPDGHFSPVFVIDNTHIIEADVGTGTARVYTYEDAWNWNKGYLVGVERVRYT